MTLEKDFPMNYDTRLPVSADTVKALPPLSRISCSMSGEALRETSAIWYCSAANFSATLLPVPVYIKASSSLAKAALSTEKCRCGKCRLSKASMRPELQPLNYCCTDAKFCGRSGAAREPYEVGHVPIIYSGDRLTWSDSHNNGNFG